MIPPTVIHTFIHMPSHIAFSAFLASAKIAHPLKYKEISKRN